MVGSYDVQAKLHGRHGAPMMVTAPHVLKPADQLGVTSVVLDGTSKITALGGSEKILLQEDARLHEHEEVEVEVGVAGLVLQWCRGVVQLCEGENPNGVAA